VRRFPALLFVAFALAAPVACGSGEAASCENLTSDDVENPAPEGVEAFDIENNCHVEGSVDYDQSPPVGGPHNPNLVNCGFYSSPVPDENAVHALEHGVVWITYDGVEDDTLQALATMAEGYGRLLVSEYPDQGSPLVLTAWNRQLPVDDLEDPRVQEFIDLYTGEDSVAPEPGASCEGGVG